MVAGPGTGKSYALKRRVARLLEEGQEPKRILAVTFTRNAAANLVEDLQEIETPGADAISVSTLHSYCFALLGRDDVFEYLGRVSRPILSISKGGSLQFEAGAMLNDLATSDDFGDKRARAKRVRAFEAAWARLQSEEPGWPVDPIDQVFERELMSWLRFHDAMLIGELIPLALRYLRDNPMAEPLQAFDHVIVDEYQDLNRAEQEVVELLATGGSSAVVGDPDQSIFSFRFANPDGIVDYPVRHQSLYDQSLTECRRCPQRVVTIANHLILNNYQPGLSLRLQTREANALGEVHVVQWGSVDQESEGVAAYVHHLLAERDYKPEDLMVLTPRRRLAYRMRDAIASNGTKVYSFYPEEALDNEAAQSSFSLLTLLARPDDRVALRWWLGHGGHQDRRNSYQKLRAFCEAHDRSPRDVLQSIVDGDLRLAGVSPLVKRFELLTDRLSQLAGREPADLVAELFPDDDEALRPLREIALLSLESSATPLQLYENIRGHITQPDLPSGDFVRVMSPQKAKGLTSKVVIVTGCIDGVFPVLDAELSPEEQAESLAEQRRLFYVAITRCTDILVLSSFAAIDRGLAQGIGAKVRGRGYRPRTITSRFIGELGPAAPPARSGQSWKESDYADPVVPHEVPRPATARRRTRGTRTA